MHMLVKLAALGAVAVGVCITARAQAAEPKTESIVLAGGCFWGVEAVFDHTRGVTQAISGYAGGKAETAQYEKVSGGDTGHAESVRVTYDPAEVSLSQLLDIYFTVAHDPTQLNYQGPDHGTQYRSEVFTANTDQQKVVDAKLAELVHKQAYKTPIVTKVEPLAAFYPAEDYHQQFAARHPLHPYILMHDARKVTKLRETYPALYKE